MNNIFKSASQEIDYADRELAATLVRDVLLQHAGRGELLNNWIKIPNRDLNYIADIN